MPRFMPIFWPAMTAPPHAGASLIRSTIPHPPFWISGAGPDGIWPGSAMQAPMQRAATVRRNWRPSQLTERAVQFMSSTLCAHRRRTGRTVFSTASGPTICFSICRTQSCRQYCRWSGTGCGRVVFSMPATQRAMAWKGGWMMGAIWFSAARSAGSWRFRRPVSSPWPNGGGRRNCPATGRNGWPHFGDGFDLGGFFPQKECPDRHPKGPR